MVDGADLDRLDALHLRIARMLHESIEHDDWVVARAFCRFQEPNEDYQIAARYRTERGELVGPGFAGDAMSLFKEYQRAFHEVMGEALPPFRLQLLPTGKFEVQYKYDLDDKRIIWGWSDDEDWKG